ncbi:MAG: hypothetical protein NVSMB46_04710 [Candidatus Saccharimonadales bacterium]
MYPTEALHLSEATQNGLDYIANHDIKAVAYPILVSEGPLTTTGLARVVSERAGINLQCVTTYPNTYNQANFASIIPGSSHKGQPSNLFRACRVESGLAVVGTMLDWSETHDIPLISALSFTASKGSRAPVNTIQLLHGLLEGANIGQITDTRYKKSKQGWSTNHNVRLRKMVSDGFIVATNEEPAFKILNPEYKGSKPFSELHETQKNIYKVLSIAQQSSISTQEVWRLSEIENLAFELGLVTSSEERNDFHNRLIRVISERNPRYSPGVTEKIKIEGRKYSIAVHFQDAAADLVERAVSLDMSDSKKRSFGDMAKEIYRDDIAFKRIINRGIKTSPYINSHGI